MLDGSVELGIGFRGYSHSHRSAAYGTVVWRGIRLCSQGISSRRTFWALSRNDFFDIEDDYLSWSECLQATGEVAGLRDRLQRLEEECRFEGISKSDLR